MLERIRVFAVAGDAYELERESEGRKKRKGRRPVRLGPCSAEGCARLASHGKPFCLEHLEQLPYVQEVLAGIAQRAREVSAPSPPAHGILACDLVSHLLHRGTGTVLRLARELDVDPDALLLVARALLRKRVVKFKRLPRGRKRTLRERRVVSLALSVDEAAGWLSEHVT